MAYSWLNINSYDLYSFCGWNYYDNQYSLADALDGWDVWVHWPYHEPWPPPPPPNLLPHWFILDLGANYNITEVRGRSFANVNTWYIERNDFGDPTDVDIYVSTDLYDWGYPVAWYIDTWQDTEWWDYVWTTPKVGRYILVYVWNVEYYYTGLRFLDGIHWGGERASSDFGDYFFKIFDAYGELVPYEVFLYGQCDGQSSTDAELTVTNVAVPLEGTVTATALVTGTLTGIAVDLEGIITATALVTGILDDAIKDLVGVVTAVAVVTGALQGIYVNTEGLVSCTAVASGTLVIEYTRPIPPVMVGTIACQSSVSGALAGLTRSYTVTVAAESSVTGRMTPIKGLVSTITCSGTCTGNLTTRTPIAGAVTSNLDVTGVLKATRRLSATLAPLCTTSGELSIVKIAFLVGEISSNSGTIGILKVTWKLTGIIALESTLSGLIATTRKFTGTIAPQSTASGSMERERHLAGTVTIVSTLTGVYLSLTKTIVGASSATSTVAGTLLVAGELRATIAAQSTTSGRIKVNRKFSGTIAAVSSTNGVVHYRVPRFVIADALVSPVLVCTILVSSTFESTENNQPVLAHAVRASPVFTYDVNNLPIFAHSTRINEKLKLVTNGVN